MFDGDERSIEPTPRRLAEARRAGYAPRSQQLTAAVSLLAGIAVLCVLGDDLWRGMLEFMSAAWSAPAVRMEATAAGAAISDVLQRIAILLAIVLGASAVAAVIGAGFQTGFYVGLRIPRSGWQSLAPQTGMRRIGGGFRPGSVGGMSAAVVASGLVTGWMVDRSAAEFTGADPVAGAAVYGRLLAILGLTLGGLFVVLGVGDWVLQRRRFRRSLRMTMAEAREDARAGESPRRARTRRWRGVSVTRETRRSAPDRDASIAMVGAGPGLSSDPQIS